MLIISIWLCNCASVTIVTTKCIYDLPQKFQVKNEIPWRIFRLEESIWNEIVIIKEMLQK